MHIVLIEPQIPPNTGNIARLCAATGCELHLVEPLGFSTDDKHLKRAGLDYWHLLKIHYHKNFADVLDKYPHTAYHYLSTKAPNTYTDVEYGNDDMLVFGREDAGIPESILKENLSDCVRIPMISEARSLNLSNSVSIVVYEALRQQSFIGLKKNSTYLSNV
ncbi:tRNA (uridine(34)/cytosine(34)/5-carboxymethylaminomethyluridine(34)-2'-O)-methyltransferase TrmL [Pectinatus sottacetonis]|uniref:tRNA (uridine(34)/cytosine(34)/5- carboxymethylaminomethyluridine(34)-2'-O)- methyltransferase TrmL n=1 Tax=Pectinatus sottacetonis TaxID=1002795 RepID=UPI0018C5D783|nr:tRNA (uridine(34)/cytosine(34)/5-carboxymethylaminomethyluridine(34)-2'-O)-methyltransferase TrmL [Pectinatus sottacetonis]